MRRVSPAGSRTETGAASERSFALYCNSGIGALETKQQDVSGAATSCVPLSPMFIWSHWDRVCGVAHSASFEVSSAQAESGTGPSPTTLKANAKMSDLRTDPQYTIQASCEALPNTARRSRVVPCRKLVLSNGLVCSRKSAASRRKDFCVDSVSSGAALGDLQFCGDRKIDRREAGFLVARLVAHFERQTLPAQRRAAERLHFHSHRHAALIDIQLALGEFELAEGALWIGDTHQAEACRKFGADFRGDQILFRDFVRIDVKAVADLQHHGDFKRPAARPGPERNVGGPHHQRCPPRRT